jgi:hypothetical protein
MHQEESLRQTMSAINDRGPFAQYSAYLRPNYGGMCADEKEFVVLESPLRPAGICGAQASFNTGRRSHPRFAPKSPTQTANDPF